MQALRAAYALTPLAKKQKTSEPIEFEDSDDDQDLDEDQDQEQHKEKQPGWAKRQEKLLQQILSRLSTIEEDFEDVKHEVANAKFQAGVAQSIAEEAMDKLGALQEKIDAVEAKAITSEQVAEMIDTALQHAGAKRTIMVSKSDRFQEPETSEKFSRTVVFGGFPRDSERNEIIKFIDANIIKDSDPRVDETFAYRFGSVGFVRFQSSKHMWEFLKDYNNKSRPKNGEREIWASVSKSPAERKKGKALSKYKRVFIEAKVAKAEAVRIDYNRGFLCINKVRVAEWEYEQEKLVLCPSGLTSAGIAVQPKMFEDAFTELMAVE